MADVNHWAESEDMLDRYVRGEVDAPERALLEAHLVTCPSCRTRVDAEMDLVRGIRSYGRRRMKAALRDMLAVRSSRRQVTWRWMAAAATIVLAVAVWYIPGEQGPPPVLEETQTRTPAENEKKADAAPPERDAEDRDAMAKAAPEPSPKTESIRSETRDGAGQGAAGVADAVSGAGAGREEDAFMNSVEAPAAETTSPQPAVDAWTVAVVSGEPMAAAHDARRADEALVRKQGLRQKAMAAEEQRTPILRNLRVSQLPFPMARMDMQQRSQGSPGTLPVEIRPSGDTVKIILYPGTPWPDSEVRSATVEAAGAESLLIRIGAQELRLARPANIPVSPVSPVSQ